jgi:hypothetical protein
MARIAVLEKSKDDTFNNPCINIIEGKVTDPTHVNLTDTKMFCDIGWLWNGTTFDEPEPEVMNVIEMESFLRRWTFDEYNSLVQSTETKAKTYRKLLDKFTEVDLTSSVMQDFKSDIVAWEIMSQNRAEEVWSIYSS